MPVRTPETPGGHPTAHPAPGVAAERADRPVEAPDGPAAGPAGALAALPPEAAEAGAGPASRGSLRVAAQPDAAPDDPRPVVDVCVVLVAHDGARWLPEVLAGLAAQTVRPRRVVAVDTGSTDESEDLLIAATGSGVDAVLRLPRRTGYGAAVAAGLAARPDDDEASPPGRETPLAPAEAPAAWVWLLHDDCAPEPDALERLLEHADREPSAVLLGPKVRDWDDPRLLVEVGLTTDTAGHRHTGLERREPDQGQHDAVRDVLAVGTAGALVRRDAWTRSGGLDPVLPLFRDDLDLGWRLNAAGDRVVVVPSAAVRHVRAATTGRRRVHAARGRIEAVDRRHALLVLLAHAPAGRLPLLVLRLLVATVLRVLGFLLTRQVVSARDELGAAASVLLRPRRLAAARRSRAATRTVPARALRPLLASPRARARARAEAFGDWFPGGARPAARAPGSGLAGLGGLGDSGPDSSDEFEADAPSTAPLWRQAVVRPGVLLTLGLLLVALLAERRVLSTSGGLLAGGRLLPPPDGARDLWSAYAASWHPVSVGSPLPAPPSVAVLAALSTLLLGKAWLAVDVLLLGSVPLAGAAAYAAASRVVRHTALRLWAGATWALLPVATGAVAAGRLDAAAVQVGLPLLLLAGARLLVDDPRTAGWRHGWALGLGLALTCALAPVLLPLAAVLLLGGAAAGLVLAPSGRRGPALRRAAAALVALLVPLVLLAPWGPAVLERPGLLLHGPGRLGAALADAALPGWHLPLLSPGGAGLPPVWTTLGLLLAAAGGTLREARRPLAASGWAVALTGLAGALVLARLPAEGPGAGALPVWPGTALQVAAAGLLLAALVAADGVRTRLAASDFGARQLGAGLVALLAAAVPVLAAGAWVLRGADDPLRRDLGPVLPAFAQAELQAAPGTRALVLDPREDGVSYALTGPEGERLGAESTRPEPGQTAALDAVVADLLTPSGSPAAAALSTRAVRYVVVRADEAGATAAALDAQQGLVRRSRGDLLLWEVALPAGRLVLLPAPLAEAALRGDAGPAAAAVRDTPPLVLEGEQPVLPAGEPGRLLVLSEADDAGWTASVAGAPAPAHRTAWGWAAAFEVPAAGGRVQVEHEAGRRAVLVAQALALGLVLVLAAPGPGRRSGLEPADRAGASTAPPTDRRLRRRARR